MYITAQGCRLKNDLYCVEWDVKLYYTIPYHSSIVTFPSNLRKQVNSLCVILLTNKQTHIMPMKTLPLWWRYEKTLPLSVLTAILQVNLG